MRILGAVERSRLLIVATPNLEQRIRPTMEAAGIAPDRVELVRRTKLKEYYQLFRRIDIALDPYPFTGHTTTCDCIWMGVPVVTLAGISAVSRAGVSVLSNMALTQLIAHTPEQYVRIATDLALDLPALAKLRQEMRQQFIDSGLTDAPRFTAELEAAYRMMWQKKCVSA
jgi:predicted O-linked N-acetylglucosamine transferase (SPINDLY family)